MIAKSLSSDLIRGWVPAFRHDHAREKGRLRLARRRQDDKQAFRLEIAVISAETQTCHAS
jgi:hypothetical protein